MLRLRVIEGILGRFYSKFGEITFLRDLKE